MSQLFLYIALHVLGTVACMAVGPWRIWLCCALGFAVGLACMVMVSLALLLVGGFHVAIVGAVYAALLGAGIYATTKRQRWDRRTLVIAGASTLGFAILCVPFCYYNFSSFSYDSHMFVMYGRVVAHDAQLSPGMLERLSAWGVFQVVAHALRVFSKQDYLYGLAPAFAVSMLASFATLLDDALDELRVTRLYRVLWIGVSIVVLLALPLFRFHVIYIHCNMASAGYLLIFVVLFWLAEVKNDTSYLPPAFLSLLSFSLLRVEAVPFAIVFLVLTVMGSRLPRREVLRCYLPYTAVLVGWFLLLGLIVPADSLYLTPIKCELFCAALSLLFAYWLVQDRWLFRHVTPYVPHLAVAACGLGIIAAYLTNEDNMRLSAGIWLDDLWDSTWWASIWKYIAILAVVGMFLPAPPHRRVLVLGIWLFFGLVLIISSTGNVFGPDIDGSLIRMTIHILPIVMFYGALKFAPLLATRER